MTDTTVFVVCRSCGSTTATSREDRNCDHCGERVPDRAYGADEPPVGRER